MIVLDDIYKQPLDKPVLFVIDYRVALFSLLTAANEVPTYDYAYQLWRQYFNTVSFSLIDNNIDVYLVIVDDWRSGQSFNYWRQDYLEQHAPALPEYKGNRGTTSESDRSEAYMLLKKAGHDYAAANNIPLYRQEAFEADDFMGALHRYADGSYQTILVTIDIDCAQLVCDKKDILHYSYTKAFTPPVSRLKSEHEVLCYSEERYSYPITHPSQIAEYKSIWGDRGDNLEPGSPIEVIDLINPPVKPDIKFTTEQLLSWTPTKRKALMALSELNKIQFKYLT